MEHDKYLEGDHVTVHSLGSSHGDKEYRAIVRGISIEEPIRIYILQMVDKLEPLNYIYSHCTLPEGCLRKGWYLVNTIT